MSAEGSPSIHLHNHFSDSTSDSILRMREASRLVKRRRSAALAITDHGKLYSIRPFYFRGLKAFLRSGGPWYRRGFERMAREYLKHLQV